MRERQPLRHASHDEIDEAALTARSGRRSTEIPVEHSVRVRFLRVAVDPAPEAGVEGAAA